MKRYERKLALIRVLSEYLGGARQAEYSVKREVALPGDAVELDWWARIYGASGNFGYCSVDEMEDTLKELLL